MKAGEEVVLPIDPPPTAVWPNPRVPDAVAPAQRSPLSDIAPDLLVADDPAMAASTIAPKGGTPFQPTMHQDRALEELRQLTQPQDEFNRAVKAQRAAKHSSTREIAQSHLDLLGNALSYGVSGAADFLTYPYRRVRDFVKDPFTPPSSSVADYVKDQTLPPFKSHDTPVFGATPRVSIEDMMAGVRAVKNTLPQGGLLNLSPKGDVTVSPRLQAAFDQARHTGDVNEAARREVYPASSTIGDFTGTVNLLAGLRQPFLEEGAVAPGVATRSSPMTSSLRDFEQKTTYQMNKGKTIYESLPIPKGQGRSILEQSPGFNALLRGAGRTGEAGAEGAAYDLLTNKDADPGSAAAFTAGVQGAHSAATEALMRKFGKLPSRVATFSMNAAIMYGALYAAGVALPGEYTDYDVKKSTAHKLILGYTLGAGLSAVSARGRTGLSSSYQPRLVDAIGSAPRNAMQKVLVDYLGSDKASRQSLTEKIAFLSNNIGKFTDTQLMNLSASFNSGNLDRFYSELDKLQKAPSQ